MGFFGSAFGGDLPFVTLLLLINLIASITIPLPVSGYYTISNLLLSTVVLIGLLRLNKFYRYTVQTVFNKKLPLLFSDNAYRAFLTYFLLARPLTMLWRRLTARFRVLPEVLIIGEVRCGTTTLSHHLTECFSKNSAKPFCPWKHPILDGKETFYFSGHYEGRVGTAHYPMCFDLKITRWFWRTIMRRPYFTFDGCAQYLNSPTAPYLIASAYAARGLKPPIIIACVRDPTEQTGSWWKYESDAIKWGKGEQTSTKALSERRKR